MSDKNLQTVSLNNKNVNLNNKKNALHQQKSHRLDTNKICHEDAERFDELLNVNRITQIILEEEDLEDEDENENNSLSSNDNRALSNTTQVTTHKSDNTNSKTNSVTFKTNSNYSKVDASKIVNTFKIVNQELARREILESPAVKGQFRVDLSQAIIPQGGQLLINYDEIGNVNISLKTPSEALSAFCLSNIASIKKVVETPRFKNVEFAVENSEMNNSSSYSNNPNIFTIYPNFQQADALVS